MKLYVGNMSYTTNEETLKEAFSNYGDVESVYIIKDKFTEQSKGFAFVEMATDVMGERAIGGMNGKSVDGRRLRVSEAVEKPRGEGASRKYIKTSSDRNFSKKSWKKDNMGSNSSEKRNSSPEEY